MYLVANYVARQGGEVLQLRCDGALPACGRDRKFQTGRTPFSCLQCMTDQRELVQWSGVKSRELSSFIVPDDVVKSSQWISSVGASDLFRCEFRGIRLWEVCEREFSTRWDLSQGEKLSSAQEHDLRRLFVAYVHSVVSFERFLKSWKPSLSFVVGGDDPVSQAYIAQARKAASDTAVFHYQSSDESISVELVPNGSRYATTLILPQVTEMRSDPRTWAPELTAIVNEMLSFLGHGADIVPN